MTSSMVCKTGSSRAAPLRVVVTRISRRFSVLMTRSISSFFCIRSKIPEIVEVSRHKRSAIYFGRQVLPLAHRQLSTPYCEGVKSKGASFWLIYWKTVCCEVVSKKLMHLGALMGKGIERTGRNGGDTVDVLQIQAHRYVGIL